MLIEYHPAVEHELREIVDYYNQRSPNLGNEFLDEFDKEILRIAESPLLWRVVEEDIRRALMQRFPYSIYFRVVQNDVVRVTVVKHQRRHPDYGLDRT
jgi:plasmid stabilization system protein ParE